VLLLVLVLVLELIRGEELNVEFYFDHEKLRVYQEALRFITWCEEILQQCPAKAAAKDHLDHASTSIALNIAEGNGKYSSKDRCRFLGIARGSALECAACLDALVAKKRLSVQDVQPGKKVLQGIVSMLMGLINSVSERVEEAEALYRGHLNSEHAVEHEYEQEHE
jgi:four helix bundle protein